MSIKVEKHVRTVVQPVYEEVYTIEGLAEDDLLHLAAILYRHEAGADDLRIWRHLPIWLRDKVVFATDRERANWRDNVR